MIDWNEKPNYEILCCTLRGMFTLQQCPLNYIYILHSIVQSY